MDMQQQMSFLMRLWQGGGGLPRIAEYLGLSHQRDSSGQVIYRTSVRSLIIGNPEEDLWGDFPSDVQMKLEDFLWRDGEFWPCVVASPCKGFDDRHRILEKE